MKQEWLTELNEIYDNCQVKDWDSYGGLPISKQSYDDCLNFLKLLPKDLDINIVPYSDGNIGISFYNGKNKITDLVFHKDGIVWCSSIFDKVSSGMITKDVKYYEYQALFYALKIFE